MSDLKSGLMADIKSAMKAGDKTRLGVLRLISAAIKQREVDERIELGDADVVAVLDKMAKQRRESIAQYESASREDLAAVERSELDIIAHYLPAALSDDEIATMISDAITETGASGIRDMGKVMGLLKPKLQGRADMAAVSAQIKDRLNA
jgi:uncharacterized protein YqeY